MATIGRFTQSKDGGWTGTIRTLTINAKVRLVPNDGRDNPSAPAYRLLLGHHHIGDAWEAQTNDNEQRPYLRLHFDDPALPTPISAALFPSEDGVSAKLLWKRIRA
ncbi:MULTISPECIES: DUF736 family protein [unclassified Azospirillum]|uniref:DUF736 domain-containing protein n=1 Tax=unclassified Azospirillum TaxID=2630922 RepID=UPI000B69BCFB|nr:MULTISPECIES: DUF736 family protein [unclassified Azospirillum]SNT09470.1 Uncharacterized conserved protein, DUF736 family [Azospirillum sp. RU38E]SNT25061.1 Uncharacterized conserved protein, DUF736 family [Azospirillum sp. RU37A]